MIHSPPPIMPAQAMATSTTSGGADCSASAALVAARAPISSAPSPPMITMPSCAGSAVHSAVRMRGAARVSVFSWQNTLTRAAPLILTALCTALPAQLGMVIIGGEGALLIGALAATSAALTLQSAPPLVVDVAMACAGMIGGGLWIMLAGALRQYRGVNETISSLLLVYIALAILNFLVEGPMRDPTSLNSRQRRRSALPI